MQSTRETAGLVGYRIGFAFSQIAATEENRKPYFGGVDLTWTSNRYISKKIHFISRCTLANIIERGTILSSMLYNIINLKQYQPECAAYASPLVYCQRCRWLTYDLDEAKEGDRNPSDQETMP
jgi:hypothetical protein